MKTCIRCTPLVSLDLIVMNLYGEILLGKRKNDPAKDTWFVPGGRILKNEPVREALARISLDEVGFTIDRKDIQVQGVYDHMYENNYFNEDFTSHYVVIACWYPLNDEEKKPIIEHAMHLQHDESIWLSIDELMEHKQVHENVKHYFLSDTLSRL